MTLEKSCEIRLPGEICLPVLETERLVLRTPRLEDAAAIAALADDPVIAVNTALIPHPYRKQDAEAWIAQLAAPDDDGATFGIYRKDCDVFIGACGLNRLDGTVHLGYWLGAPYRDARPCHRGRPRGHRFCLHAPRADRDHLGGARHQRRLAPGAGEVRLPVDRRRADAGQGARRLGAGRPLPARPQDLGELAGVGRGAARRGSLDPDGVRLTVWGRLSSGPEGGGLAYGLRLG